MTSRLLIAASTAVLLSSLPAFAATSPYSAIYSFGDSLSDVGNLFLLSENPANGIPHQPLYPYSEGRFSNGPLWVQDLSAGLGLGPVTPSLLGGDDYAFGGATTGTTEAHAATPIDLPTQIAEFGAFLKSHPSIDPSAALYTLSIGANDIFAIFDDLEAGIPVDPATVIVEAAANLASAASQLQSDGAKDLVLFDVPNLGLTPAFNTNPILSADATGLAVAFNTQVQADLAPVEAAGLEVTDLDTFDLLTGAVNDPGAYGFTNATVPCWTGSATGGISSGALCSDTFAGQNEYLFWDEVHPTAAGHLLVANDALDELGFPPLSAPVPEPSTWAMLLLGFAGLGALGARKMRVAATAA